MLHDSDFALVAAVNDDAILASCLAASPDVRSGRLPLIAIRGASDMAQAYNEGLGRVREAATFQQRSGFDAQPEKWW